MEGAIAQAKAHITKLLPAFPLDRLHVATFNTVGRVVSIKHASAAGVENAFRGITAGGGTAYAEGVRALQSLRPAADEDVLFIFVGDEQDSSKRSIAEDIRATGLNPLAIGLIPVVSAQYGRGYAVRMTAIDLGVPCFEIDERVFSDPYAVPRTLRDLIAATPVNRAQHGTPAVARVALVETILKTPILVKPVWAA